MNMARIEPYATVLSVGQIELFNDTFVERVKVAENGGHLIIATVHPKACLPQNTPGSDKLAEKVLFPAVSDAKK